MKWIPSLCVLLSLMGESSAALSDEWMWSKRGHSLPPVDNQSYAEECGSCHFAYQPALLPAASWKKLLSRLENHFGENAELPQQALLELNAYLDANAADKVSGYKRADKIMRSLGNVAPLRITEVPYIHYKHHEIPSRIIKNNPDIRSLSNCANCHTRAETGSYAERDIRIPGLGRWEDD
jgi:cytochrome c553